MFVNLRFTGMRSLGDDQEGPEQILFDGPGELHDPRLHGFFQLTEAGPGNSEAPAETAHVGHGPNQAFTAAPGEKRLILCARRLKSDALFAGKLCDNLCDPCRNGRRIDRLRRGDLPFFCMSDAVFHLVDPRRGWRRGRRGRLGHLAREIGGEQRRHILGRRVRQRHQAFAANCMTGFYRADLHRLRHPCDGRAKREEMAALQFTNTLRLPTLHPEQVGCTDHVDVEKSSPHQKVRSFGSNVFGELRQSLGRDHPGQSALAAAAHEIGHRRQRHAARILSHLARRRRGEHLRLVHHDQGGIPMFARGIEQSSEKLCSAADLLFHFQAIEIEHNAGTMFTDTAGKRFDFGRRIGRAVDDNMAELVRERGKVAFGIDDNLLHHAGALFEQATQQV